jgi:hypothetical protein
MTSSVALGHTWAPAFDRLDGGRLLREMGERVKHYTPPDLLAKFCAIAESANTDSSAVTFARKWGMLGLCQHGLPLGHSGVTRCPPRPYEESEHWLTFARCLECMQRLGLSLNRGTYGDDLDWEIADLVLVGPDFPPWDSSMRHLIGSSLQTARTHYQILVRRLIQICELRPRFHWSANRWNIDMDSESLSNLPAILATQLMLTVGEAKRMLKCASCPRWFIPTRNQRKYCSHCGIRAAWREAATRKRRADGRSLLVRGNAGTPD